AHFALIEGQVRLYRDLALVLMICDPAKRGFPVSKMAYLVDDEFKLTSTGKLEAAKLKTPTAPYLAFCLRCVAEGLGIPDDEIAKGFGDNRWKQMIEAMKRRDSLMHPKDVESITVTAADIDNLLAGYTWFNEVIGEISARCRPDLLAAARHALVRKND